MASKMLDKIRTGLSQEESAKKPGVEALEEKIKRANEVFKGEEALVLQSKTKTKKDTFTIPEDEYILIQKVIERAMKLMKKINKSEVVRLGLTSLIKTKDDELLKMINQMERLRVGRPRN